MKPSKKSLYIFMLNGLFIAIPPFLIMVFFVLYLYIVQHPAPGTNNWLYGLAHDSVFIMIPYIISSFLTGGFILLFLYKRKLNNNFVNSVSFSICYFIAPFLMSLVFSIITFTPKLLEVFIGTTGILFHYIYLHQRIPIYGFYISAGYPVLLFGLIYGAFFGKKLHKVIHNKVQDY